MKVYCKISLCIATLFLLIMCSACGSVQCSVKDFAKVTVVGYSDHGTLSIKVNDEEINKIYADGSKDKTAALRFAETFKFTYDGQDDENFYFSNGDVVTINVSYDEELAKALDLEFIDTSFDFTVQGLEDKQETSPFDGLSVKFSGVAPYGTVQLDKSNCIQYVIDNVTFYCDNYDLSNGDKVVVRAEFNSEIAEKNGYIFTEDVKKYTVVGLSKYVTTMAGVSYDSVTAKMHRMVETYVSAADTSYKSLDWYFGEEDSETDYFDDSDSISDDEENIGEYNENEDETDSDYDSLSDDEDSSVSSGTKKLSNIEKIKSDFVVCDFNASFEYEPIGCYYSLNSIQYSDNVFSAAYKVTGTFVCTDSNGSGYINPGDTVVGEIYVIASLSGGSVDIKNNLYYEDSTLKNYHSYSCRSFSDYNDFSAEIYGNTSYLTENLDYVEDTDVYNEFVKQLEDSASAKFEVSHITIDSSTDTDSENESNTSSSNESESDTDSEDNSMDIYSEDSYYDPEDYSEEYVEGESYEGSYEDYYEDDSYVYYEY